MCSSDLEIRKGQLGAAKLVEQDEDVALLAGRKKGKGKGKQDNSHKDYSKVKCWNCQKIQGML